MFTSNVSPSDVRFIRALGPLIERKLEDGVYAFRALLYRDVLGQSSGPFKQAQLTAMGHPYSTRDPRPPIALPGINEQTGLFKSMWSVTVSRTPNTIRVTARNNAPYAGALDEGTKRMIPRQFSRIMTDQHALPFLNTAAKALP